MSLKLIKYKQFNLIYTAHLPGVTVGVGVTIEPLDEDEKLAGGCALLVKGYGVLDSVSNIKIVIK